MKNRLFLGAFVLIASAGLTNCGKKDSDSSPTPQTANSKPIEEGVDERILGSWLMTQVPVTSNSTGEEIPGVHLVLSITIAKDKLTATSEVIDTDKVMCRAEASTSQFVVNKNRLESKEDLSKKTVINEKNDCEVNLKKFSLNYSLESNDTLKLTPVDNNKESIKASRIK